MIPVCKKSNRLVYIRIRIEPQWTRRTLGNLKEPDKRSENADAEQDQTHPPPFAVAELNRTEKDCQRRQQRKCAKPCCAWCDTNREPRQLTPQQIKYSRHHSPIG